LASQDRSPGRRYRRPGPVRRLLRQYFPSLVLVLLAVVCIFIIVYTVDTVISLVPTASTPVLQETPDKTNPTNPSTAPDYTELIAQADLLAAGYDYQGAIALLQNIADHETDPQLSEKISQYSQQDSLLIPYVDIDAITHLCFKSLIVDPARAFDGDAESKQYNQNHVTITEFKSILQNLYDKGYVLVSPYDVAIEGADASGNPIFRYGSIRLPVGKTPFLLSQEDLNYYGTMIGTGSGINETPVFADAHGDGFASRIVLDENGQLTCEYVDANGNITTGDYDLFLVLERFIQEHPDFSYHGARGILAVSGYEGVFGYRTKPSYEAALGKDLYDKEVAQAKTVAEKLREKGWVLASNSYGNPSYANIDADRLSTDSDLWEETVESIIGPTDILLFPHGQDIAGVSLYSFDDAKFSALYENGYRYFFNADSKIAWCQMGNRYFRASRRIVSGYRMYHNPDKFADLFVVDEILDPARPTPVPSIFG